MAFKKNENVIKYGHYRKFSAINDMITADYWQFKYKTLNTDGSEWYAGQPASKELDNSGKTISEGGQYPDPHGEVVGTIFLDSTPESLYLTSEIGDVIIDTEPPVFISEDVQYMVFNSNRVCKFTIESDTLIDVCQLRICCGDDILYSCQRKEEEIISPEDKIIKLSYNKNKNNYILTFTLLNDYDVDLLNENQLTIEVWDIAGNKAVYKTAKKWYNFNTNPDDLLPLIIEFVTVEPEDKILSRNVEGRVKVRVYNPNIDLWEIQPTVGLFDDSIGYLDETTLDYDPTTGVLTFYITHINKKGYINVEAWIDIDNSDIRAFVKNKTYATASLGPFIYGDEGRKYKFNSYTPTYLNDELYKRFVKHVETFLNTSQESLNTGNAVSTLEKIARINNFNDPQRIETPLLQYYYKQFNIEVNPNLNEYMFYLNHMGQIEHKYEDTKVNIDEE